MKCKKCGAENARGNLFCDNCGHEFEKCPVCQKIHGLKKFCPIRGFDIIEYVEKQEKIKSINEKFCKFEKPLEKKRMRKHWISSIILLLFIAYFLSFVENSIPLIILLSIFLPAIYLLFGKEYLSVKKRKIYITEFAKQFPDDAKYLV